MTLGDTAAAVGKGLFAGAAGTVAMTISSTLEAKLRDRDPSSWGSAQAMLPALDIAPSPWESPKEEVLIDALHHAVYAIATGLAFAALQRNSA